MEGGNVQGSVVPWVVPLLWESGAGAQKRHRCGGGGQWREF